MNVRSLAVAISLSVLVAAPAHAQFSAGIGGGTSFGSRGEPASGTHGLAFVQLKLPVLPGIRGDAIVWDAPEHVGRTSVAVSVVWSPPIPIITPYVLGGFGKYHLGESGSRTGWNLGVGAKVKFRIGIFAEVRRHQRIPRDLITVGLTL